MLTYPQHRARREIHIVFSHPAHWFSFWSQLSCSPVSVFHLSNHVILLWQAHEDKLWMWLTCFDRVSLCQVSFSLTFSCGFWSFSLCTGLNLFSISLGLYCLIYCLLFPYWSLLWNFSLHFLLLEVPSPRPFFLNWVTLCRSDLLRTYI